MPRFLRLAWLLFITILAGGTAHAQRNGGPYALDAEVFSGPQSRQVAADGLIHAVSGISTPGQALTAAGVYEMRASSTARRAMVLNTLLVSSATPLPEEQTATFTLRCETDRWGEFTVPAHDLTLAATSGPLAPGPGESQLIAEAVYQDTPASAEGSFDILHAIATFTVQDSDKDNYGSYAGDGLDDVWQITHFGFDNPDAAPDRDTDYDGYDNRFEFTAGLDPNDSASQFRIAIHRVPGQPTHRNLVFSPVMPDRSYQVKTRTDLSPGEWLPLAGAPESNSGDERTVTDTSASEAMKFYRVEITKP